MSNASPSLTDKARLARLEKEKRLAEALRANLHRRKSQARARADGPSDAPPPDTTDDAQTQDTTAPSRQTP